MENKEKIRVSLFLDRQTVKTADKIMKERGFSSRNEFYSAMLKNMIADEVTEKYKDVLGEKFAKELKGSEEEIKTALSKGLFRYAVHLEMIASMLADYFEYSEDEIMARRHEAYKNVRRLRGKIPLEKILAGYYVENKIEVPHYEDWNGEEVF